VKVDLVATGRQAYQQQDWPGCWAALTEADRAAPLAPADLGLLAISGYLTGHDESAYDALARAYNAYAAAGDQRQAARSAFYLAFLLQDTNEPARASGWVARARALVDQHDLGGAEAGLLGALQAHELLESGAVADALALAERSVSAGRACGDPDVVTLALLTVGHAHVSRGDVVRAVACLDEVMLAVSGDELIPPVAGLAYCSVIAACMRLHDLRRAREWTAALTGWCDAQPGLVPYRGICLVHRAELMTMSGNWAEALVEATRASEFLRASAAAEAFYRLGELQRLRGDFAAAETAYRRANTGGRLPEPGLLRLRLAQGRADVAAATARHLLSQIGEGMVRLEVLAACIDAATHVHDLDLARTATDELERLGAESDEPLLAAFASRATGQVLLADGRPRDALPALRRGWQGFQELDLPYEAAQVRTLIGECCRGLGEEDSAQMEFDAARWWFDELGAVPDRDRVAALALGATRPADGGLTARELQVLRLVAAGRTNRAVADELFLSEKTVARHVSNIFTKLDVPSRSAATAYAYEHALL
jgi:DNA-binding CsgD family transcriptional regulator